MLEYNEGSGWKLKKGDLEAILRESVRHPAKAEFMAPPSQKISQGIR
jgi:hypothetical protein